VTGHGYLKGISMLFDIPLGSGELVVAKIEAVKQKFAVEVEKRTFKFGGGLGGLYARTKC
jgi:hypothetical protein